MCVDEVVVREHCEVGALEGFDVQHHLRGVQGGDRGVEGHRHADDDVVADD